MSGAVAAPSRHRRLLLGLALLAAAIAIGAIFVVNPYDKWPRNMLLGLLLLLLGFGPLLRWAQQPQADPVPVLAMMGLFYAVCYGVAGFVTPDVYIGGIFVREEEYTIALIAALTSLVVVALGFLCAKALRWPQAPRFLRRDDARINRLALYLFYPATFAADQAVRHFELAAFLQITQALHTLLFVWVMYATFSRRYSAKERLFVLLVLLPVDVSFYSGLAEGKLAGLLVYSQLVGLSYVATTRRVPYLALLCAGALFFVLEPVKSEYRRIERNTGVQQSGIAGVSTFINLGIDHYFGSSRAYSEGLNAAYSRINHLQVTAAVMLDTPDIVDYRHGETYLPLLTKFIPRALWPEKPREDLGNRWARDYRYLDASDDVTSFNLPWVPEMYMNYGWTGILVVSFLVGVLMAGVWCVFARDAVAPLHFAAGLLLCSSFFFPESNLSIEVGDLVICIVVILVLAKALQILFPEPVAPRTFRRHASAH